MIVCYLIAALFLQPFSSPLMDYECCFVQDNEAILPVFSNNDHQNQQCCQKKQLLS